MTGLRTINGKNLSSVVTRLNYAPNPTFRGTGAAGSVEVRRNHCTTPGFELTQAGTTVLTNLLTNPSAESSSGWLSNNGTLWTVSYDTTTFYRGTRSVKCTVSTAGSNSLSLYNVGGAPVAATATHWYTFTLYLRSDNAKAAQGAVSMGFLDSGGSSVGSAFSTSTPMTIGQWTKVTVSAQAPANTATIRTGATVTLTGGTAVGDYAWADSACLTEGISTENFDGSMTSPDADFTYAWSGTADASTSVKNAIANTTVVNRGNSYTVASSQWKASGTRSMRIMSAYAVGAGSGYYEFGTLGTDSWFVAGHTYTVSAVCYIDPANPLTVNNGAGFNYSESVSSGNPVNVATHFPLSTTGQFTTSLTFTVSSNATAARIRFYNAETQGGPSIWIDSLLVEEAGAVLPYFDGATAAANDLSYSWTGTANNSESICTGASVTGWTPNVTSPIAVAYSSTTGRVKVWSAALYAKTTSTMGYSHLATTPLTATVPGDTWTASAYVYCATAQTATMLIRFRDSVNIGNAVADYTSAGLSIPANTWTRVSFTITAPAGAAAVYCQPTISTLAAGTTVFFDDVLLEKAAGPAGGYFDGSLEENTTTSYRWLGTTDLSTSEAVTKRPISILLADGVTWAPMSEYLPRTNAWPNPAMEKATTAAQTTRSNYCTNPSFETGLTGWSTTATYWNNPCTLTTDNTWSAFGTQSAKAVCDGTQTFQGFNYQFTGVANSQYAMSATIKNDSGRPVALNVRDITNGINASSTPVAAGTTARVSVAMTTGASTPTMLVAFSTDSTLGASTFHVDGVLIEKPSTAAGTYFDGSTAASGDFTYAWVGAAHASNSVEQAPAPSSNGTNVDLVAYTGGTKGWLATGGGKSGSKSFRVEMRGGVNSGALLVFSQGVSRNPHIVPVSPGDAWAARISMRTTTGAAVPLRVAFAYYSGSLQAYANAGVYVTLPADGSWSDVVIPNVGVSPATATSIELLLYANAQLPAGTVIDIDSMYLEKVAVGASPGAYFDGSTPTVRTNVITNPNFETDASGWGAYTGVSAPTRSTMNPYSGSGCLQAVGNNTSAAPRVYCGVTSGLYGGDTWTLQARIRMDGTWPTGYSTYCAIRWQLPSGAESIALSSGTFTPDGSGYMLVSVTSNVPLNCTGSATLNIGFQGLTSNLTSAGSFSIDNVMFEKSSSVNTYCDTTALLPDYTYAWSGTVNGSPSVATP